MNSTFENWRAIAKASAAALAAALLMGLGCKNKSSDGGLTPTAVLNSIALSASSVTAGTTVQGTATLSAAAPSGGATVTLGSSGPAAATPGSITIGQGSTSGTFSVTTAPVVASTQVTVTGTYSGTSRTATLTVTPAAVVANFTFTPTSGSPPAGQCAVTQSGSNNKLLCVFDGSSSTPSGAITEYRWQFPGAASAVIGVTQTEPTVPCGGFGGATTTKDVILTVTAPQGSNTVTKSITFVKVAPC